MHQRFSEAALRIPILDFLRGRTTGDVLVEYGHPTLQGSTKRGRPRQLDFVGQYRSSSRIKVAVETKWQSGTLLKGQSVVDDLLRLEALKGIAGSAITRQL